MDLCEAVIFSLMLGGCRKGCCMSEFSEIPVIDVAAVHGDDTAAKQKLAQEFATAYGETGFGYIKNHGVDAALIQRVAFCRQITNPAPSPPR